MESLIEMWNRQTRPARIGLVVGAIVIVAATTGLGLWAYRTDYQVLFADLSNQDAASMAAELDRAKVPYQLTDNGNTILVPKELVYKTRLKMMEKDVPLHGAVGFEVFNNADFGMTDFVQKVNYQRAIQGELTRTIMSIDEVAAARVHLALPEQGLFKKGTGKPKASVTITPKRGRTLVPEQVVGIQRLVAASVPDIMAEDVTVLDQHGIALTRAGGTDGEMVMTGSQLDAKRSTEDYLMKKVTQVLDRALGPGEAIASVDVALNMDQSHVTTEEVLPAKTTNTEGNPTGVTVRERQTLRDGAQAAPTRNATHGAQSGDVTSFESEYQVGRRIEQVTSPAGGVRRLTVAVVVKKPLDEAQSGHLKEVVSLALGINSQRGDAVVVTSMDKVASGAAMPQAGIHNDEAASASAADTAGTEHAMPTEASGTRFSPQRVLLLLTGLLAFASLIGLWHARTRVRQTHARRLSADERARMLADVQTWIEHGSKVAASETAEVRS